MNSQAQDGEGYRNTENIGQFILCLTNSAGFLNGQNK